jgi:orotidine-5'-phosphate decarboxylase
MEGEGGLSVEAAERVIWSADVPGDHEVMTFIDLMIGLKRAKVDRVYIGRNDEYILAVLRDRGIDVFYDAKYIEIPSKLEELAKQGVKYQPWMLNCMAGSVSNGDMSVYEDRDLMDGLMRFADVCLTAGTKPCGVTVLTSKTEEIVAGEFNDRTAIDQVLWYVEMLVKAKFTDVVCSPKEVPAIRERFGDAIDLDNPGIRFADSDAGDQARVATPGSAVAGGSTCVIMGRPLTNGDPAENFARAVAEIEAVKAT